MGDLNDAQYIALLVAFILSSLLSICGSTMIIILARRDMTKVYHRTLVMLSVADVLLSASNTIHLLLVPQDKTGSPYAIGNDASCSGVGFVLNVLWAMVAIYNAFLSINFVLQIRYQYTDVQLSKCIEPMVHLMAIVLCVPLPLYGIIGDAFNPDYTSGLCLMVAYPRDCHQKDDVACIRGDSNILAVLQALVVNIVSIVGFVCTWLLYRTVKGCLDRTKQRSLSNTTSSRHDDYLRNVSWQCTRYALAYLNTWFWPLFHQILANAVETDDRRGEPSRFIPILMPFLFFPLQGMFNFVVFIAPKYQEWKLEYPGEAWWYLLRCSLSNLSPRDSISTASSYGHVSDCSSVRIMIAEKSNHERSESTSNHRDDNNTMIGRQSGRSSGSSSGMRWSSQSYAGHRSSSGTQSSRASFLRRSADTAVRSPLTAPQTTRRQRESVRGSILHFIPNMPDEMFESSELSMTVEQQTKTIGMSREGSLEDEVSEKPTEDNEEILDAGEMDECVAGDGAVAAAVANDAVPDDAECAEGTNEQESGDDHEYGEHVKADDER